MPLLSLNSWSLHRNLGPLRITRWNESSGKPSDDFLEYPQTLTLLELPGVLAEMGFQALEITIHNIPDSSGSYAAKLREAFEKSGIVFFSLLIDYGDISSPDPVRRDADKEYIRQWIDFAWQAGAVRARIVAGESDSHDLEALSRAAAQLHELVLYARKKGVRLLTENYMNLASTAENCLYFVEQLGDDIALTADFGNFKTDGKYEQLAKILPYAESIHAKANVDENGDLDVDDFIRCLNLSKEAGFRGAYALVYDGPGDQWAGIHRTREMVEPYL